MPATVSTHEIFNEWYLQIRSQNSYSSADLLQDLKEQPFEGKDAFIYNLLKFRVSLLDMEFGDSMIAEIDSLPLPPNSEWKYFQLFFKGLYYSAQGNHLDAVDMYKGAEPYLTHISDPGEQAEFHYKTASAYFNLQRYMLAYQHLVKIPDHVPGLFGEKRRAHAELLKGLVYKRHGDFEDAEFQLHSALKAAEQLQDNQLKYTVLQNLGMLYSEKGLTAEAVNYYSTALTLIHDTNPVHRIKTLYMLSKEFYQTAKREQAFTYFLEGIRLCRSTENKEYLTHFNLLNWFNTNPRNNLSDIKSGIEYFEKEQSWEYVHEYSQDYANLLRVQHHYIDSCTYYHKAIEAKKRLKGILE